MPLTAKGQKIMANMKKQYGGKEGESVFYASKNKGNIEGVDAESGVRGKTPNWAATKQGDKWRIYDHANRRWKAGEYDTHDEAKAELDKSRSDDLSSILSGLIDRATATRDRADKIVADAVVAPTMTGLLKFAAKQRQRIDYLKEDLNGSTTPEERNAINKEIRVLEEAIRESEVGGDLVRGDAIPQGAVLVFEEWGYKIYQYRNGGYWLELPMGGTKHFHTLSDAKKEMQKEMMPRSDAKMSKDDLARRIIAPHVRAIEAAGFKELASRLRNASINEMAAIGHKISAENYNKGGGYNQELHAAINTLTSFKGASLGDLEEQAGTLTFGARAPAFKRKDAEIKQPEKIPVPATEGRVLKTGDKYTKDGKKGRIIGMRGLPDESYILSVRWDDARSDAAREYPFLILINGSDAGGGGGRFKTLAEAKKAIPGVQRGLRERSHGREIPSIQVIDENDGDKIVHRADDSRSDGPYIQGSGQERSWIQLSSAQYQQLVVGKSYRFGDRVGTVVEKSETGINTGGGRSLPGAFIRWKREAREDDDRLEYVPMKGRAMASRSDASLIAVRDRLDKLAEGVHRTIRRVDAMVTASRADAAMSYASMMRKYETWEVLRYEPQRDGTIKAQIKDPDSGKTVEVHYRDESARSDAIAMPLRGHPYHEKTDAALRFIIRDAGEAAKAMKSHDPRSEAKYLDQVNDASTVLYWRSKGGKQQTTDQRVDAADPWDAGYAAYGKAGATRNPHMNDSGKAREYHAGWMAAQKDEKEGKGRFSRADGSSTEDLIRVAQEIHSSNMRRMSSPADRSEELENHREIMKHLQDQLKSEIKKDGPASWSRPAKNDLRGDAAPPKEITKVKLAEKVRDGDWECETDINSFGRVQIIDHTTEPRRRFSVVVSDHRKDATGRKYYTLLVDGAIHFGDYDRSVVQEEMNSLADHPGESIKKSRMKIVTSGDTQEEINKAIGK